MWNENHFIFLIVVLYVMIVCDLTGRYQDFEVGMETVCSSKTPLLTSIPCCVITWETVT